MEYLNSRGLGLKPSETLAVKARAAELKGQGRQIFDLSAGEPDIDTPEHIKAAAVEALRTGKTKYTAVPGIPELRTAIASKFTNDNGIPTKSGDVIVTNGGKQALYSLFQVLLKPGDEVVVIAPYWVSYPPMVELAGGSVVVVRPASGFKATPAELAAAITARTKVVVINSPSNPTGVCYTAQELSALGDVIARSNALVVSDEVYERVVFGDFRFTSFAAACPKLAARTITVNAFSKAYSMTGWRVGYATGPTQILDAMIKHQSQTTSNVCAPAQYAALAALSGPHDFIATMNQSFVRRYAAVREILSSCPGLTVPYWPEGAFYLFLRFDSLAKAGIGAAKSSAAMTNYLLDSAGVAVVPGEAFGDDSAFRISVSSADQNIIGGVQKIVGAIEALK